MTRPPFVEHVVRALADAPYSVEKLREIAWWEVMPRFGEVAPEWAGFDAHSRAKSGARPGTGAGLCVGGSASG